MEPTDVRRSVSARRSPGARPPIDLNTGLIVRGSLLRQQTSAAELHIGYGSRDQLLRRIADVEATAKGLFDPDQPREQNGRWAAGSAAPKPVLSEGAAGGLLLVGSAAARSLAGGFLTSEAAPVALVALSEFAVPILAVGAVVLLGYLFIRAVRSKSGAPTSGTVSNRPDITYSYIPDSDYVVLSTSDGAPIFSGVVGHDDLIRDPDGVPVGRRINGAIIINDDILPDITASAAASSQTSADSKAKVIAAETTAEPEVCPDPVPDRKGWKSDRAVAYQAYISTLTNPVAPLPPGLAVRFRNPLTSRWVYFDDCDRELQEGKTVEAKGPGYGKMYDKNNAKLNAGLDAYMTNQARRQISAAGGRPMEWDFADKTAADRARMLFTSVWGDRINVRNIPFPGS